LMMIMVMRCWESGSDTLVQQFTCCVGMTLEEISWTKNPWISVHCCVLSFGLIDSLLDRFVVFGWACPILGELHCWSLFCQDLCILQLQQISPSSALSVTSRAINEIVIFWTGWTIQNMRLALKLVPDDWCNGLHGMRISASSGWAAYGMIYCNNASVMPGQFSHHSPASLKNPKQLNRIWVIS
jgi:hypothetical protein